MSKHISTLLLKYWILFIIQHYFLTFIDPDYLINLFANGSSVVIWLGDLNYRIALSYSETQKLLMDNDWDALLDKDQVTDFASKE